MDATRDPRLPAPSGTRPRSRRTVADRATERVLRVRMLGMFELDTDATAISLRGSKSVEVLCLLMLAPGHARSRDALACELWPDVGFVDSRKYLRQALWRVHEAIDAGHADAERFVLTENDAVRVNGVRRPWCDALELAELASALARHPATVDDDDIDAVLALYRGPLLDGCYSNWCLVERERHEGLYLTTLDAAAARAELRGDHRRTEHWAMSLLHVDPAHECSHQRLMRAYAARGDRTRALRQFDRCERSLDSELGVTPSPATVALASAIRDGRTPPDVTGHDEVTGLGPEGPFGRVLRELASLRRSLDELRRTMSSS